MEVERVTVSAAIDYGDTRISYKEKDASGVVTLEQEWEAGDKVIGYWGDNKFEYEVANLDGGIAELQWSKGYKLKGTESNVTMYYAPGIDYSAVKPLSVDYSDQDVADKLPCTLMAVNNFDNGNLRMNFNCVAAVLAIRGIEGFAGSEKVTSLQITGTSTPTITVTNGSQGWTADKWGTVNDTIKAVLPVSSNAVDVTVKAVTESREVKVLKFNKQITAGKYYYTQSVQNVAAVEDGTVRCFKSIDDAVAAANYSSANDVKLTLLANCTSDGELVIDRSKKVTFDLAGKTLLLPGKGHQIAISNSAELTVVSSEDGGFISQTIKGTGYSISASYAIKCNSASLKLLGGTVTSPTSSAYSTSVYVNGGGSIFIDGGSIEGARCLWIENNGTSAEIKSGVLTSTYEGSFTDRNSGFAVMARDTASLTISGGEFLASYDGSKQDSGQVAVYLYTGTVTNISGGFFEAESDNAIFATRVGSSGAFPEIYITGGTFISSGTVEGRTATIYPYSVKNEGCKISPADGKKVIVKSINGQAVYTRAYSYSRITVEGGYFSGKGDAVKKESTSGTLSLKGGYFTSDVSAYKAKDYSQTTGLWDNGTGDGIVYGYQIVK